MDKSVDKGIAIITGASSGIGRAIAKKMCEAGYEVYGFGRNFDQNPREHFHPIVIDLQDTAKVESVIKEIMSKGNLTVLVNNAGVGYYGLHEELSAKKIQEMVRVNLEVPMILAALTLRELKKNAGFIINIASVTADKSNPHGCAYGATKAGLNSFSHSLFDEARKYGVKSVVIKPDMTATKLYRNADFEAEDDVMCSLQPDEVAEAVWMVLNAREGLVFSEISIKPQYHRIHRK